MVTVRTPAFLRAPAETVAAQPWMIRRGADEVELGESLPSFDPGETLELRRRIIFDPSDVAAACGLDGPHQVAAVALWATSGTGLRGSSRPVIIASPGSRVADLQLSLEGGDLGGILVLRTALILAAPATGARPLVARVSGSVLWEGEGLRVDLEGTGTRFPTELRAFGTGSFPPKAAWFLDWDREDLNRPVLGSLRLYLNDKHPLMTRVASGPADAETACIRETLKFEIARELITGALTNNEFCANPGSYDAESVGAAIWRLCTRILFPNRSVGELAAWARDSPSRFAAELQSALKLYWQPVE